MHFIFMILQYLDSFVAELKRVPGSRMNQWDKDSFHEMGRGSGAGLGQGR